MSQWTAEEVEIVEHLLKAGYTHAEVANALAEEGYRRTRKAIERLVWRRKQHATDDERDKKYFSDDSEKRAQSEMERLKNGAKKRTKRMLPLYKGREVERKYIDALDSIDKMREFLTGMTKQHFACKGEKNDADFKILSLSDLHIPMHNTDVIMHALKNHGDADMLVLNGDILDLFSVSSFPKDKEILLRHEYKLALEMIKMFSEVFPRVQLVSGNHSDRLKRYFSKNLNPTVSFMVNDDILVKLADGEDVNAQGKLEKKYDFDNVFYDGGLLKWYFIHGQCVFAHPSHFSKDPMKTALNIAKTLSNKEQFQCVVAAHTHKMGKYIIAETLLIEQGCVTVPLEYEASSKAQYTPQSFGYAVIYQDASGNVDFNRSGPVFYGTESLNKAYLKEQGEQ